MSNPTWRSLTHTYLALTITTLISLGGLSAQDNSKNIETKTKVHRLTTTLRSPFDAFVYVNRIPETPDKGEDPIDFAGRVYGRLANQEGRILLKLPPGMDRKAYLGFKSFLGSEGDGRITNCVTCHVPDRFTDGAPHVTSPDGTSAMTPSLRNRNISAADLKKLVRTKMRASEAKRSGTAHEIDDAYSTLTLAENEIPNLVAFLQTLDDVSDAAFRKLIVDAKVLDTTVDIEPTASETETQPNGIIGRVRFDGTPPERRHLEMDEASLKLHPKQPSEENVVVEETGGLANVFIRVKKGLEKKNYSPPAEPALIDQVGSIFRPRVQGLMVGQELVMRNSDPFIHNVRSLSLKSRAFNIAQPPTSKDRKKVFKRAEGPIRIACDFHQWMEAYVFVVDHPFFAVTDSDGRFEITGLGPGDYTLEAWHEVLGKQTTKITIGESGSEEISFTFSSN